MISAKSLVSCLQFQNISVNFLTYGEANRQDLSLIASTTEGPTPFLTRSCLCISSYFVITAGKWKEKTTMRMQANDGAAGRHFLFSENLVKPQGLGSSTR